MENLDDKTTYVFVRQDMSFADQFVQGMHAHGFVIADCEANDKQGHASICLIGVPDLKSLERVEKKLDALRLCWFGWTDPDNKEFGVTAIAVEPLSKEDPKRVALKNYRLWLPISTESRRVGCATSQDRPLIKSDSKVDIGTQEATAKGS
jgi:hypothetical protein